MLIILNIGNDANELAGFVVNVLRSVQGYDITAGAFMKYGQLPAEIWESISFMRLDVDAERRRKTGTASLAVPRQETRRK